MKRDMRKASWQAIIFVLGVLFLGLPAIAQSAGDDAPPLSESRAEDALKSLAEQVKQLQATVLEMRAEVARSREETRELRGELEQALGRHTSVAARPPSPEKGAPAPVETQAQTPPTPAAAASPLESESRLSQLEEGVELLKAKISDQYQTKVESSSKYRMKLSGIVLLNLFGNSGTVDNQDVPNLALPRVPLTTGGSFGGTVRQSELGFEAYGPTLASARTSAALDLDFFGGFPNTSNGVTSGLARIRTATVRLDWAQDSVVAGQDAPFFSPLSPTSFASLGYPEFSYAGNLWTWIPQLRVEHRVSLSDKDTVHLEAGILDPLSGEPPSAEYYRTPQAGEQSRQPAYASHLAWSHNAPGGPFSLGIGGYYSRQNYGADRTVDAWAGTGDWNLPLGRRFSLSGEFYRGRALGGLGASEDRSVVFSGPQTIPTSEVRGLNTVGGWAQLKYRASETVEFNAAYGQDNPFNTDLRYFWWSAGSGYGSISKNQAEMFNIIYRPRTDLLFALEYRHLNTLEITSQKNLAGQVNLSMGVLF